jgi:hypothetical protein
MFNIFVMLFFTSCLGKVGALFPICIKYKPELSQEQSFFCFWRLGFVLPYLTNIKAEQSIAFYLRLITALFMGLSLFFVEIFESGLELIRLSGASFRDF